mmetsp:Transcript_122630/g.354448  ORF Transcript_122630/g.354448 Transcript_122630/m.354448 type:complete len:341 (-) Transcript_122630:40-1062(-)
MAAVQAAIRLFATVAAGALAVMESPVEYEYRFSEWSPCTNACGAGVESRTLECWVLLGGRDDRRRVPEQKVSNQKCDERKVQTPLGFHQRVCVGASVHVDYCLVCSPESKLCTKCLPGFELRNRKCKNGDLELLLELSTANAAAEETDRPWRLQKLDSCVQSVVARAAGVPKARASVYAIVPAQRLAVQEASPLGSPGAGAATRAVAQVAVNAPGQRLTREEVDMLLNAATKRAAHGAAASGAQRAVGQGEEACPTDLRITGSRVICPGARPANASGRCQEEVDAFQQGWGEELAVWLGVVVAGFSLAGFSALWYHRLYRKRRLGRLMVARDVQLPVVDR